MVRWMIADAGIDVLSPDPRKGAGTIQIHIEEGDALTTGLLNAQMAGLIHRSDPIPQCTWKDLGQ